MVPKRSLRVGAGMQFDRVDAKFDSSFKLGRIGVEKQAHDNTGALQSTNSFGHLYLRSDDIEAAFGRHFFAAFGDERRLMRRGLARNGEHLVGTGEFQVDRNRDRLFQNAEVALLDMPAVFAEVDRDCIGAAQLGQRGGPYGVRLVCFTSFANGGYVIDVDAEDCHGLPTIVD